MDYSSFSIYISYASYAGVATGLVGFLAAKLKKPILSSLFVLVAIGGTGVCFYSSTLAMKYSVNNFDQICEISPEGKEIMNQW